MWRHKKLWEGPTHPWQKDRIKEEKELMKIYGLKNKREIWKAETIARKIRFYVRYLNARKAAGFDVSKEEEKLKTRLLKLKSLITYSDINKDKLFGKVIQSQEQKTEESTVQNTNQPSQ